MNTIEPPARTGKVTIKGGWTTIYRCTPGKAEAVLRVGCGA